MEPPTPGTELAEGHLPPHQRKSVTQVPVTPGVALGTYTQDYFAGTFPEPTGLNGKLAGDDFPDLPGNIISVTFTVPHTVHVDQNSAWVRFRAFMCPHNFAHKTHPEQLLRRNHQRSTLLDSLRFLSAQGPRSHTVVAWTGEIHGPAPVDYDAEPLFHLPTIATPSATPLGEGPPQAAQKPKTNELRVDRPSQQRLESQLYEDELRIVPVWLADENDISGEGITLREQSKWRRYAKHDLCALLHYKQHPPDDGYKEVARWADYRRMSHMFADKVCEVYRPGDVVLVHDYCLMLLPELLRQRHPDIRIVFFLHTPFPSSELVRCLTRRKDILQGVLSSDLIALQSFHYAQHFANSCSRILGLQASSEAVYTTSRRVQLEVVPAGINVADINSLAWTVPVTEKCMALRKLYAGKQIIVACDPIDRLGGVDKKLLAFDRFLEMYPEWRERVVLLQVFTQQSVADDDDGEESRYVSTVNALVNSVNCKYGSLDYMPIQLQAQSLSTEDYFAILRSGDVALFTNIRDGMSTTSLEYVVCQQNTHGCPIISEFSGTASNLEEAIRINPWDTADVAKQIHEALSMTADARQDMFIALYRRITKKDVRCWVTTVLSRLMNAVQGPQQPVKSPAAARISTVQKPKRRLLMRA